MKCLIVDDHALIRRGLREVLDDEEQVHFTFTEAANYREALAAVSQDKFDLILLDIALGGRNGLEVLSCIRQQNTRTPVLIISMYPEEQYAIRALKLGANGYLTKDAAPTELAAAVTRILAGGRYVTPAVGELLAAAVTNNRHHGDTPHAALSNRELQIACMIASGRSTSTIAADLHLSPKTVGTYRLRLLKKLPATNTAELTAYCIQHGLSL